MRESFHFETVRTKRFQAAKLCSFKRKWWTVVTYKDVSFKCVRWMTDPKTSAPNTYQLALTYLLTYLLT